MISFRCTKRVIERFRFQPVEDAPAAWYSLTKVRSWRVPMRHEEGSEIAAKGRVPISQKGSGSKQVKKKPAYKKSPLAEPIDQMLNPGTRAQQDRASRIRRHETK